MFLRTVAERGEGENSSVFHIVSRWSEARVRRGAAVLRALVPTPVHLQVVLHGDDVYHESGRDLALCPVGVLSAVFHRRASSRHNAYIMNLSGRRNHQHMHHVVGYMPSSMSCFSDELLKQFAFRMPVA